MNVARDGQQCAVGVCVCVKRTPSAASRSAFGVMHGCPADTTSACSWSVMKMRMFGRVDMLGIPDWVD